MNFIIHFIPPHALQLCQITSCYTFRLRCTTQQYVHQQICIIQHCFANHASANRPKTSIIAPFWPKGTWRSPKTMQLKYACLSKMMSNQSSIHGSNIQGSQNSSRLETKKITPVIDEVIDWSLMQCKVCRFGRLFLEPCQHAASCTN